MTKIYRFSAKINLGTFNMKTCIIRPLLCWKPVHHWEIWPLLRSKGCPAHIVRHRAVWRKTYRSSKLQIIPYDLHRLQAATAHTVGESAEMLHWLLMRVRRWAGWKCTSSFWNRGSSRLLISKYFIFCSFLAKHRNSLLFYFLIFFGETSKLAAVFFFSSPIFVLLISKSIKNHFFRGTHLWTLIMNWHTYVYVQSISSWHFSSLSMSSILFRSEINIDISFYVLISLAKRSRYSQHWTPQTWREHQLDGQE